MKMRISVEAVALASRVAGRRMVFGLAIAAGVMAQPANAREGVEVGNNSPFAKFVPAEQVERSAAQQYLQMLSQADSKRALAHSDSAELKRLRSIAQKIIPFAIAWNPRAKEWKWEVNLIGSNQINAYCMPGGKIAFFTGILQQLV